MAGDGEAADGKPAIVSKMEGEGKMGPGLLTALGLSDEQLGIGSINLGELEGTQAARRGNRAKRSRPASKIDQISVIPKVPA